MNKANTYKFSASWTENERMRMAAWLAARIHAAPILGTREQISNISATIIYVLNGHSEWLENNRPHIFKDAGIEDLGYPDVLRVSLEAAAKSAVAALTQQATFPADIALAVSNLQKALDDRGTE